MVERFRVVVCGGGIAGIEGLLRLRRLAGDRVDITLLTPSPHFDYKPLAVLEPFMTPADQAPHVRYPMERIAADMATRWVPESLRWVDRHSRVAYAGPGKPFPYDALLLAVGARGRPADPRMDVFSGRPGPSQFRSILDEVLSGQLTRLAFVVPPGPSWPFPLYELALMTARRARERGGEPKIVLATPESQPLHVFGDEVSAVVSNLLGDAGIDQYCGSTASLPTPQQLVLQPSGLEFEVQRTVTLQPMTGPDVKGIPGDPAHRFLEIDLHCRVRGADGSVFAAGDATSFPIKHGALSAQQADTAAAGIAHLAQVAGPSKPLHPVLRGQLSTGGPPVYLSAHVIAGRGWQGRITETPPWDADGKVVAAELNHYLAGLEPRATGLTHAARPKIRA